MSAVATIVLGGRGDPGGKRLKEGVRVVLVLLLVVLLLCCSLFEREKSNHPGSRMDGGLSAGTDHASKGLQSLGYDTNDEGWPGIKVP